MSKQYRQGDVFIEEVSAVPPAATVVQPGNRGLVLAEGEVTGHAHCISDTDCEMYAGADGELYIRVGGGGATVRHEEHGPITLVPGIYKSIIQREYHPAVIRRVVD